MRDYLLNRLTEQERLRLEEAYFADDAVFEELDAAEHGLADDFVRGRLRGDARAAFESRLQESPRLRRRVAVARDLLARAGGRSTEVTRPRYPAMRMSLRGLGIAATLVVVAGAWWLVQSGTSRQAWPPAGSDKAVEQVAQPSEHATKPETLLETIALTLSPGITRSDGTGIPVLVLPEEDAPVRLTLEHDGGGEGQYVAILRTPEGRTVWEQPQLTPVGTNSLVLTTSARLLPPGDYVLTLATGPPGGRRDLADYPLTVARR